MGTNMDRKKYCLQLLQCGIRDVKQCESLFEGKVGDKFHSLNFILLHRKDQSAHIFIGYKSYDGEFKYKIES